MADTNPPSDEPEHRPGLVVIAQHVSDYSSPICLTLSATALALWSLPPHQWLKAAAVVLGISFAIAGIVLQITKRPTHSDLRRQVSDKDAEIDAAIGREMASYDSLAHSLGYMLRSLMKECNAWNSHTRATLYCYRNKQFVPLARESNNPVLEKPGRPRYPGDEGLISEVWRRKAGIATLPADAAERVIDQVTNHNMSEEAASALQMPSLVLSGLRIDHNDDKVGVLIVESTNVRGVTAGMQDAFGKSPWIRAIETVMHSSKANLPGLVTDNAAS